MLAFLLYRLSFGLLHLLVRAGLDDRELESAVLRHQLRVLTRGGKRPRYSTADRAFLAAVSRFLPKERWSAFPVLPETLKRWRRQLEIGQGRRPRRGPGRPPIDPELRRLILRLGRENPRWGYLRIKSELLQLGITVSATTIANVLRRGGLGPAPRRIGPTWGEFLRLQAYGLLALGAPGVEEGPENLASDRRELPAGTGADPGPTEEDQPIHDDPPASTRRPLAAAEAPERGRLGPLRRRTGTCARDGPAMAA